MYSFPNLDPICCSMSSSNCFFLTCIHIFQESGQVVWYSHLFKHFPQFVVIHTVKGFGRVNEAEIDVFLELSCFFNDPMDVGNLIPGSSAFSKSSLNIWKSTVLRLSHTCTYIPSPPDSPPIPATAWHWAEFPELCSRSLLVLHVKYSHVSTSIPNHLTIPSPPSVTPATSFSRSMSLFLFYK